MAREPWYSDLGFHILCIASMVGTPIILQARFSVPPLQAWVFGPVLGVLVSLPVLIVLLGVPLYVGRAAFRWLVTWK